MKKILILILLLLPLVSAYCDEGQIDINTARLEELDEIYGIGPVKAQAIIDTRPFESINDLINVYGIGEITLDKIIDQGLACVADEEESEEKNEEIIKEEVVEINEQTIEEYVEEEEQAPVTPAVIKLGESPKDIKSEDDKKILDKTDYARYGFIAFCILIGVLLILKNKKKNKNELV